MTFHTIPDSQNTAVTNDLTKFAKSLLIHASNDANSENTVNMKKFNNIYIGNCTIYISGVYHIKIKIKIIITIKNKFTSNFEMLTKVGIVDIGNFIFVTK